MWDNRTSPHTLSCLTKCIWIGGQSLNTLPQRATLQYDPSRDCDILANMKGSNAMVSIVQENNYPYQEIYLLKILYGWISSVLKYKFISRQECSLQKALLTSSISTINCKEPIQDLFLTKSTFNVSQTMQTPLVQWGKLPGTCND